MASKKKSAVFNCGYGHGFSVKEVVQMLKKVSGVDFPVSFVERRAGDATSLVAQSERLKKTTNWTFQHENLEEIVRSAYLFEKMIFE